MIHGPSCVQKLKCFASLGCHDMFLQRAVGRPNWGGGKCDIFRDIVLHLPHPVVPTGIIILCNNLPTSRLQNIVKLNTHFEMFQTYESVKNNIMILLY